MQEFNLVEILESTKKNIEQNQYILQGKNELIDDLIKLISDNHLKIYQEVPEETKKVK